MKHIMALLFLILLITSCTVLLPEEEVSDYEFSEETLQGTIFESPYLFKEGRADEGKILFTFRLFDVEFLGTKPDSSVSAYQVSVHCRKDTTIQKLDWDVQVTVSGGDLEGEYHMSEGAVKINPWSDEDMVISGALHVSMNDDIALSGKFSGTL